MIEYTVTMTPFEFDEDEVVAEVERLTTLNPTVRWCAKCTRLVCSCFIGYQDYVRFSELPEKITHIIGQIAACGPPMISAIGNPLGLMDSVSEYSPRRAYAKMNLRQHWR